MRRAWRLALLTALALSLVTIGQARGDWSLQRLGVLPGDEWSAAMAIAADGATVVGTSQQGSYHIDYQPEAFRWTASGGLVGLGFLPGNEWSEALGVSADGAVVVGYSQTSLGEELLGGEAFRWTAAGGMQGLGYLPGHHHSKAMGVSANGKVIVGFSREDHIAPRHAFAWTEAGGMVDLGLPAGGQWAEAHAASADGSVIIGDWGTPSSGHRGFLWNQADGFLDLGDDVFWAADVSADGSVVVGGRWIGGDIWLGAEAFRWTAAGGMVGLGNLSPGLNDNGEATGVSADGSVVVGYGSQIRPLVWDASHGTRDFLNVLAADGVDISGGLGMAHDVALNGGTLRIVGDGNWMATHVVPEPAGLTLALAGLVGFLALAVLKNRVARRARCVACGVAVLLAAATGARAEVSLQGLGHLPEPFIFSAPLAVSADGSVIVGESRAPDWQTQAFCWTAAEGMVGLGFLTESNFSRSLAYDVSADGAVIVGSSYAMAGPAVPLSGEEAFVWTRKGGMVPLFGAAGGAVDGRASVVSGDGSIVLGTRRTSPFPEVFRWTADRGVHDPGLPEGEVAGISADGSAIAGTRMSMETVSAYLWTEATGATDLGPLPGQVFRGSFAQALSADGSVVVGGANVEFPSDPYDQAFRWTREEGMANLAPLVDQGSVAWAASADGAIVVGNNFDGPFIWDQTRGLRMLEGVLTGDYGLDLTGWRLEAVTDISADGRVIVGYGVHNGDQEAWRVVVPEPTGLLLALAALAGLLACPLCRRWRQHQNRSLAGDLGGQKTPSTMKLTGKRE
ncbi:MAG: hypothetical protein ACYC0Y_09370 [Pirellulales bacterium]